MADNIKTRIIRKIQEYIGENQSQPSKVYLTQTEELDFFDLTYNEIGELAQDIFFKGPRKTFGEHGNTFLGKELVWDADEFRVGE